MWTPGQRPSISREIPGFSGRKRARDCEHHAVWIGAAIARAPRGDLRVEIERRLAGERRIGRTYPFALDPMAIGACGNPARGVTACPQYRWQHTGGWRCRERHRRIISRHRSALFGRQSFGNRLHLRMKTKVCRIALHLPLQIAGIDAGKPRRAAAVAAPLEPMASKAGGCSARIPAAHRDQLPGFGEAVGRRPVDRAAARAEQRDGEGERRRPESHLAGNRRNAAMVPLST